MDTNKCPKCGKTDYLSSIPYLWVESYGHTGTNTVYPRCKHCNTVLKVVYVRQITLDKIEISDKSVGDWG